MTVVVDTNVILVANGSHDDVSAECVTTCVACLTELVASGTVAIDDGYRIVREYQNKTVPRTGKGVGDVFVKWVLSNLARSDRVAVVAINEVGEDSFQEFPAPDLANGFDPPDRKFAAVANAHPEKPPILQAADCKWADWWPRLHECGLTVRFLCVEDICQFYERKFPGRGRPCLP